MSPMKLDGPMVRDTARQAAAQIKPAAERAVPYARSAGQAARLQLLRTRAWAAPQIERSGQVLQDTLAPKAAAVLQDTLAPKAAAMLSEAARRIDPAQPRHRRWLKGLGFGLATLTAAAGAIATWLRARGKPASVPGPATIPDTMPNGQARTVGADTHS